MGTDIHWVLERRHANGDWHAVLSDARSTQISHDPKRFGLSHHQVALSERLGDRDYTTFGVLSGIRRNPDISAARMISLLGATLIGGVRRAPPKPPGPDDILCEPGLPDDTAESSRLYFDDPDLHGKGTLNLQRFRESVTKKNLPHLALSDDRVAAEEFLKAIDALLAVPELVSTILVGPRRDEATDEPYPEMSRSAHAHIESLGLARGLLPISDDTVRLLVAYDS